MSGGAVFRETLRVVVGLGLGPGTQRDVLAVLEAARPGPLELLYDVVAAAELPRDVRLRRAAGVYLGFAAGSLADDLIDGDCDYLAAPFRHGPHLQSVLQHAFFTAMLQAGVPPADLRAGAARLVRAAGAQFLEVRTQAWTAPTFLRVAEGIAADQWAAYVTLLWAGTPLAPRAVAIGRAMGLLAHVAEDARTGDVRFTSMAPGDQAAVFAAARVAVAELRGVELPVIARFLGAVAAVIPDDAP